MGEVKLLCLTLATLRIFCLQVWQYITLMRRIFLIDCPGVVYPSEDSETDIVLKGVVCIWSSQFCFHFGGALRAFATPRSEGSLGSACVTRRRNMMLNRAASFPLSLPQEVERLWAYLVSVILQQYVVSTWDPEGSRACLCLVIIHVWVSGLSHLGTQAFLTCFWMWLNTLSDPLNCNHASSIHPWHIPPLPSEILGFLFVFWVVEFADIFTIPASE